MKIALINMPFGYLRLPSIALTQLKTVLSDQFGSRVKTDIHYLNHEFGAFISPAIYDFIAESPAAMHCNIGEWFFRRTAFPDETENEKEYLEHFGIALNELDNKQESIDPALNLLRFYSKILLAKRDRLDWFIDHMIEKYQLARYDVVGLTSMFSQNLPVFALARKLKEMNPHQLVVMGGANCESPMGEAIVKNIAAVDFVFSGPALISFPLFINHILQHHEPQCHAIDGVFSKKNIQSPEQFGIKPRGQELDINSTIRLDYDEFLALVKERWKALEITPVLLFETSRGCWWGAKAHCTFCGLNTNSMAYRTLSPDKAITMINDLFKRYGREVKHYSSVDNIMPRDYLKSVFPFLKPPDGVSMFYEVKADLTKEELEILAKSHILTLQPGIESLNTSTLKLMKKGETAIGNIALLKNASVLGIDLAWNILIGFPGEEAAAYEVYEQDFKNLYHLQPPKSVYGVRFDRYSPYHSKPLESGLHLVPADFYFFLYPESMYRELDQIAYYFEDADQQSMHRQLVSQWMPVLLHKSRSWASRFSREDDLLKPELYYDYDQRQIKDSRNGYVTITELEELDLKILEAADQPVKLVTLHQVLKEYDVTVITDTLYRLIASGFIYHENHKKYLSLVHLRAYREKKFEPAGSNRHALTL